MKINHLTSIFPYAIYQGRAKHSNISGIFAPDRFGNFFMSDLVGSAENTTGDLPNNLACSYVTCLAPDTLRFKGTFKQGHKKMTTINDISGVYANLRQILKKLNQQPGFDSDVDEAESAICNAINALETAIAYLPMEDSADKKIKLSVLKKTITELCEDANGELHLEDLNEVQRAQLAICLQLIKE